MYEVVIINDNKETVINAVSTDKDAPKITGTIKKGINVIDSFTFNILPKNPGFNILKAYKTHVKVFNTKSKKYEFIGRVLPSVSDMQDSGAFIKKITCESILGYLIDSKQDYEEYQNISPKDYLKKLIEVHNSRVENYKRFEVRNVTVKDSNDSLYRYSDYTSTWDNINEDLIKSLGGEIQIEYTDDKIYIDYLTEIGKTCADTAIRFKHNLQSISNQPKFDDFYTRYKFLGAKLKTTDAEGNEVQSDERLTIKEVNNGKDYLDYEEGIEAFGIIEGVITYDDITEASNLLTRGKQYISSIQLGMSNTVKALDLSLLGLDFDSFEVGNYYPVIVEPLYINYFQRVIEKSIEIRQPSSNTITLGEKKISAKDYYVNNAKIIQSVSKNNNQNVAEVKAIVASLGITNKNILKKIEEIEGDSVSVEVFNQKIQEFNQNFNTVTGQISEITKQITEINKKLDSLQQGGGEIE